MTRILVELIILIGIPAFGFSLGGWIGLIIGIAIATNVRIPHHY